MPYLRGDFELIGLSRDAVLRVHEAFLKAAIMIWAINSTGHGAVGPTKTAYLLSRMLSLTGLNPRFDASSDTRI